MNNNRKVNRSKGIKLYNVIFPIWIVWLIPLTWILVVPANFIIDLAVILITLKLLKVTDIKSNAKATILRVWIFGFIADFIGTAFMFLGYIVDFGSHELLNDWWYKYITQPIGFNPFDSVFAVLWVTLAVVIAGVCIYLFNFHFCLNKSSLDKKQKKKLALALAILTAPYTFYLPTEWFYHSPF